MKPLYSEKRREPRVPLRLYLNLDGVASRSGPLQTVLVTRNLSRRGVCFEIDPTLPIQPAEEISGHLGNDRFHTGVRLRVVWRRRDLAGAHVGDSVSAWPIV